MLAIKSKLTVAEKPSFDFVERPLLDNCKILHVKKIKLQCHCVESSDYLLRVTGCQSVEVIYPLLHLLCWGRDKEEMILPLTSSKRRECLILLVCLPHLHMLTRVFLLAVECFLVLYSTYPPSNKALERNHY